MLEDVFDDKERLDTPVSVHNPVAKMETREEFWETWTHLRDYLLGLCRKWMDGSWVEPEEALSGAMLRAWEGFDRRTTEIRNPRAWITRITHNHCMDLHREEDRLASGSLEAASRSAGGDYAPRTESPEEAIVRRETFLNVQSAIQSLPERLREPIILRCIHGYTYNDISKRLNISAQNARKRVQQAREKLNGLIPKQENGILSNQLTDSLSSSSAAFPLVGTDSKAADLAYHKIGYEWPILVPDLNQNYHRQILILDQKPIRLQQKLKTLDQYVRKFSGGWKKRWELGQLSLAWGDWARALTEFHWITENHSWFNEAMLELARLAHWRGEHANAARFFRDIAEKNPDPFVKIYFEGLSEWTIGNTEKASQLFREAHEGIPQWLAPLLALASCFGQKADYPRLHSVYGEMIQIDPGNETLWAKIGRVCLEMGLWEESRKWLDKCAGVEQPGYSLLTFRDAWRKKSRHIPAGQRKAIKREARSWKEFGAETEEVLGQRITFWEASGVPEAAAETLEKLIKRSPLSLDGHFACIEAWLRLGKTEAVANGLQTLYSALPDNLQVAQFIMRLHNASFGRLTTALPIAEIIRKHPDHWEIQVWGAGALAAQGSRYTEILPLIHRAVELQPMLPGMWLAAGRAALMAGNVFQAKNHFKMGWESDLRAECAGDAAWLALHLSSLFPGQENWLSSAESAANILQKMVPSEANFILSRVALLRAEMEEVARWQKKAMKCHLNWPLNTLETQELPFTKIIPKEGW